MEFALIATALVVLLLAIIELGRYFFTWSSMEYAMEQATRYALVNEDAPISAVEEYAISQMPSVLVDINNLSVEIIYTNESGVDFIELAGTYDYRMLSPILPDSLILNMDLNVISRMPVP